MDGSTKKAYRRELRFHRCSPTSTFTTSSTCGPTSGGDGTRAATMMIVRFADDYVVGFEHRDDAERFHAELRDRLAQFSLELNAEKTRLIEFGRFAARERKARGLGKPETFRFLGFTHICAKNQDGAFQASSGSPTRSGCGPSSLPVKGKIERRRHLPDPRAGALAGQRPATGTTSYYAVPGNSEALSRLPLRGRPALVHGAAAPQPAHHGDLGADVRASRARWLPQPAITASLATTQRFDARNPRQEPSALGSGRQGCDPAGESPVMLIVRVEHVATPHPGSGNRPGDAWCERPGRPAAFALLRWEQPGGRASVGARR